MKRVVQIIIYVILCSHLLNAQQVTRTEAINAAINVMGYRGNNVQSRDIDTIYRLEKNGNTLIYEILFQICQ